MDIKPLFVTRKLLHHLLIRSSVRPFVRTRTAATTWSLYTSTMDNYIADVYIPYPHYIYSHNMVKALCNCTMCVCKWIGIHFIELNSTIYPLCSFILHDTTRYEAKHTTACAWAWAHVNCYLLRLFLTCCNIFNCWIWFSSFFWINWSKHASASIYFRLFLSIGRLFE